VSTASAAQATRSHRRDHERKRAERRIEQPRVCEHAREHGERRDAQDDGQERAELDRRHALDHRRMHSPQCRRDGRCGDHRDEDRGRGYPNGGLTRAPHALDVDFEADPEHEQDDGDVREHAEMRTDVVGEQEPVEVPWQQAEQARPEQEPGDDLSDHHRLPDAPCKRPERECAARDDGEIEEQGGEQGVLRADGEDCHRVGAALKADRSRCNSSRIRPRWSATPSTGPSPAAAAA